MTEKIDAPRTSLDKGQRIGVILLVCITLVLIGVSFIQFNSSIRSYGTRLAADGTPALDPNDRVKQQQEALKKIDTDADAISDYDEIFIYHTSPYIRDTDSDGKSDGEEVQRGTSPVCPEGKDCSIDPVVAANIANTTSTSAVPTFQTSQQAGGGSAIVVPQQDSAATETDISKISPAELRKLLISKGVPKDKLDALTDTELMDLMKETQTEDSTQHTSSSTPSTP